jgi:ALG6, ALG8 glycosyltransferase family
VHEKSILMPMLPLALLHAFEPRVSTFMLALAPFSMFPLLLKDGQALPYLALTGCVAIAAPDIANAWRNIVAHVCGEVEQAVDSSEWERNDTGEGSNMHVEPMEGGEVEPPDQMIPEPSDDSQVSSTTQVRLHPHGAREAD